MRLFLAAPSWLLPALALLVLAAPRAAHARDFRIPGSLVPRAEGACTSRLSSDARRMAQDLRRTRQGIHVASPVEKCVGEAEAGAGDSPVRFQEEVVMKSEPLVRRGSGGGVREGRFESKSVAAVCRACDGRAAEGGRE